MGTRCPIRRGYDEAIIARSLPVEQADQHDCWNRLMLYDVPDGGRRLAEIIPKPHHRNLGDQRIKPRLFTEIYHSIQVLDSQNAFSKRDLLLASRLVVLNAISRQINQWPRESQAHSTPASASHACCRNDGACSLPLMVYRSRHWLRQKTASDC